ncbi:hypothetical protein ABW20_dc0109340 [Dactylellina cionopaga]|nr:hypothetical protein ABW20_dc0109340 [Dactylellina cionopaga]
MAQGGSPAARSTRVVRRGVKTDGIGALLKVAGGILGNRIFQDYKYKTVYPMSNELGYRIEPTWYEGGADDEYLPAPHSDEIKYFPEWDYAWQIWTCIDTEQHDEKTCVNEISCCLGVDKACENIGKTYCVNGERGCKWNPDASQLTIFDHTHPASGWLTKGNAADSFPQRGC